MPFYNYHYVVWLFFYIAVHSKFFIWYALIKIVKFAFSLCQRNLFHIVILSRFSNEIKYVLFALCVKYLYM